MRRHKHIYANICSFPNLLLAARRAQRGKRFRPDVHEFNARLEENLLELQRELETGTWAPGPYRVFHVQESKRRQICAAPYRDRIVHHALCNVLEPLFERRFIFDSYACRKGKGTHAAADRYTEFSLKARYALKGDISRYFASIRHDALLEAIARVVGDRQALGLCERIVESWSEGADGDEVSRGMPIGNQTSQFFANVYLDRFDHWMKEEVGCRHYIRYVDDFVVLSDDKRRLGALVTQIEDRLAGIGLTLHPRKRTVFPVSEGCDFMGYRIWPDHRRIRPENGYRFRRRLRRMAESFRAGTKTMGEIKASVMSWIGHAAHADTWGLRRAIFRGVTFSAGSSQASMRARVG